MLALRKKQVGILLPVQLVGLLIFVISSSSLVSAQSTELIVQTGHSGEINQVALTADGRFLATGSDNGTVKLWSVPEKRELRTFKDDLVSSVKVAITADGNIVAGTAGSELRIWETSSGKGVGSYSYKSTRKLKQNGETWTSSDLIDLAFSPDGKFLVVSAFDGDLLIWDVAERSVKRTFSGDGRASSDPVFSPDGKLLASIRGDRDVLLWNFEAGKKVHEWPGSSEQMFGLAFNRNGTFLAGGDNRTARVWSVGDRREIRRFADHDAEIGIVRFLNEKDVLVTSSGREKFKFWDIDSGNLVKTIDGDWLEVSSFVITPDDQRIISSNFNAIQLSYWDITTSSKQAVSHYARGGSYIEFSPDSNTLLVRYQNEIVLYRRGDPNPLQVESMHGGYFWPTAFSGDSLKFAAAGGREAKLWDVKSGSELRSFAVSGDIISILLNADASRLLIQTEANANQYTVWDTATRKLIGKASDVAEIPKLIDGFSVKNLGSKSSPNRNFSITARLDDQGAVVISDSTHGGEILKVLRFGKKDWAAVTPKGLFDGTPSSFDLMIWRLDNRTLNYVPVEAFFKEFYRPGLLSEIMSGRTVEAPETDLGSVDIRQPGVRITAVDNREIQAGPTAQAVKPANSISTREVEIAIEVTDNDRKGRRPEHGPSSGAQDVRLFRNGSLVKVWRGDVLKGKASATLETTIPIIAGANRFTAYTFNHANVKSSDATLTVTGAENLKRRGVAHVLAVGVDVYSNPAYNLSYSVADAKAFGAEISRWQGQLGRFERTDVTTLLNEQATKKTILAALQQLSGKAKPEDAVMIYFAGHGTAEGKRFYLIPHDLGYAGTREQITSNNGAGLRTMLQHSISDQELEEAVSGIDAGQMLFVIDACNSGQALEAEEKRRGPMNSPGLAQLAYEKGMYILTASQSFQFANESALLGHGYLTYALVEQGLKSAVADSNRDGMVDVREWFVYATEQVPRIYEEQMQKKTDAQLAELRSRKTRSGLDGVDDVQRPRVFYRREAEPNPLVVSKPGLTTP